MANPVCGNCAWSSRYKDVGEKALYCDNEKSPRGDEDVLEDETCGEHEFKETKEGEAGQ